MWRHCGFDTVPNTSEYTFLRFSETLQRTTLHKMYRRISLICLMFLLNSKLCGKHWLILHDVQNIFDLFRCFAFLSLWSCYWKYWRRWAEVPLRALVDSGRECDQRFLHGLEYNGSYSDTTAAYSPHQNRMAGTLMRGLEKYVFENCWVCFPYYSGQEVDELMKLQQAFGKEHGLRKCESEGSEGW